MGWFSKKKESNVQENPVLPDLPESIPSNNFQQPPNTNTPDIPYPPQNNQQNSNFPDNNINQQGAQEFNQNSQNFINEPKPGMKKSQFEPLAYQEPKRQSQKRFIRKDISTPIPQKTTTNFPQNRVQQSSFNPPKVQRKNEPVYIRLDKFQLTMDAFKDVKDKIKEIEELLLKTKQIKAKEDKELDEWEKEIESIKLKIQSVDKDIFTQ
ncbi:hypothetical protein GOV12_05465 [Candidatus Pacearchaeota archaeon]|nr:hypothetical protein [Candidatus Pacearchaeota archaeon]